MDIILGLDFGTHQSKLCMSYMPNNETIFEFVEFNLSDGSKSYFFPSIIQINKDQTLRIGSVNYETCETIPIPPPDKPVLPVRPIIEFPKEPDQTLPPEPSKAGSVIVEGSDWLKSLQSIKDAIEKQSKSENDFKREHKDWEIKCQQIRERHDEWKRKCSNLNYQLKQWQEKVDSINAKYQEEYESWKKHSFDYRVFRYFKQSAFTTTLPWDDKEISADIVSIWYLTYLLLYARKYVRERFDETFEESVSVQMGVPSGLDNSVSRMIHYRGQRYLVSARHLMELFQSPEDMCTIGYRDLLDMTKYAEGNVVEEAEQYGFVIIPEAYAGLQSLTYSRRLTRGNMHLLVDIGGGTTDISFFTIDESLMPSIHTVTSFHKGLNYILEHFIAENPDYSMGEAQGLLLTNTELFNRSIQLYKNELKVTLKSVVDYVVEEFNKELCGTDLKVDALIEAMIGRPIVYCGGGSVFPKMKIGHSYFTDIRMIDKDTLNIPNLINKEVPPIYYTILATSYGLSIPAIEEILPSDIHQLWKTVADNVRNAPLNKKEIIDYNLSDD